MIEEDDNEKEMGVIEKDRKEKEKKIRKVEEKGPEGPGAASPSRGHQSSPPW